jgi:hypothetical protein
MPSNHRRAGNDHWEHAIGLGGPILTLIAAAKADRFETLPGDHRPISSLVGILGERVCKHNHLPTNPIGCMVRISRLLSVFERAIALAPMIPGE